MPDQMLSGDGGAAYCRRQCCLDDERLCRTWVVRSPRIGANCTDEEYGNTDLDAEVSDQCRGTAMGSCVEGVGRCCFLIDDEKSVPYVNAQGEDEGPATGSMSGQVFPDRLWSEIRGFNYMPVSYTHLTLPTKA